MSTFDDTSTDQGKLRALLNDRDSSSPFFQDDGLANLLLQANRFVTPTAPLSPQRLYYAAYLGWMQKSGDKADKSKRQQIAIIRKDTHVTYVDTVDMAEHYRKLSCAAGDIHVQIPEYVHSLCDRGVR